MGHVSVQRVMAVSRFRAALGVWAQQRGVPLSFMLSIPLRGTAPRAARSLGRVFRQIVEKKLGKKFRKENWKITEE